MSSFISLHEFQVVDTLICTTQFLWSSVLVMIIKSFCKTMCVENH